MKKRISYYLEVIKKYYLIFLISISWLFLGNSCPVKVIEFQETCENVNAAPDFSFTCVSQFYEAAAAFANLKKSCEEDWNGEFSINENKNCPTDSLVSTCRVPSERDGDYMSYFFYSPVTDTEANTQCEALGGEVLN